MRQVSGEFDDEEMQNVREQLSKSERIQQRETAWVHEEYNFQTHSDENERLDSRWGRWTSCNCYRRTIVTTCIKMSFVEFQQYDFIIWSWFLWVIPLLAKEIYLWKQIFDVFIFASSKLIYLLHSLVQKIVSRRTGFFQIDKSLFFV